MIEVTVEYLASQGLSKNFPQRFWRKVSKTESCWIWTGNKSSGRYGEINKFGGHHLIKSHRASWILHYGPIPEGYSVCHRCDNPACVRPDHLWIGTHDQNMKDMVSKGRSRGLSGERHNLAKLNQDAVAYIRKHHNPQKRIGGMLARKFGVTRHTICSVFHNKSWM
jgi:hypothetical protein